MALSITPLNDKIVVERLEADDKTAGGIILPDTAKEKPKQGKVLAVGEGKHLDNGKRAEFQVKVGDRVRARVYDRIRIVEVTRVIEKRVGAPIAQECYIDHTPPEPTGAAVPVFRRERGAGRPTKRDRRMLDQLGLSRGGR